MIKILLKHLIYEKCINVLFDQVSLNFSNARRERIEAKMHSLEGLIKHARLARAADIVQRASVYTTNINIPSSHYYVTEVR